MTHKQKRLAKLKALDSSTQGLSWSRLLTTSYKTGSVRVLVISSGERLPGLAVPTLREQGVDVEFENY